MTALRDEGDRAGEADPDIITSEEALCSEDLDDRAARGDDDDDASRPEDGDGLPNKVPLPCRSAACAFDSYAITAALTVPAGGTVAAGAAGPLCAVSDFDEVIVAVATKVEVEVALAEEGPSFSVNCLIFSSFLFRSPAVMPSFDNDRANFLENDTGFVSGRGPGGSRRASSSLDASDTVRTAGPLDADDADECAPSVNCLTFSSFLFRSPAVMPSFDNDRANFLENDTGFVSGRGPGGSFAATSGGGGGGGGGSGGAATRSSGVNSTSSCNVAII